MIKAFEKYSNIFLFSIIIFIGLIIYKDYGISIDEKINRYNGLVNLKYIFEFFSVSYVHEGLFQNVTQLNSYGDKYYGAALEMFNVFFIEILLNKSEINEIYYLRHFINHSIFVISLCFFYLINNEIFKNKYLSIFGVLLLYTTPRIFAHSFYNGKDLAFLSFFIIMIYFAIKCLKNLNVKNIFYFSFFFALAANLRIVAIYIPFLLIFFIFLDSFIRKKKSNFTWLNAFLIFFLSFLLLFISFPFLWENPVNGLLEILKLFSKFERWDLKVFYLGEFYKGKFLPWHYLFVSIFITTPLAIIFMVIGGLLLNFIRLSKRIALIDNQNLMNDFWKSNKEKLIYFILASICIPVLSIFFLDSVLYNGWRHFYFIYPLLIIHSLFFAEVYFMKFYRSKIKNLIPLLCFFILFLNIFALYKYHPYQNVFFNNLFVNKANKLFEKDYWGLVNYENLNKILKLENEKVHIGVASFTDLDLSKKLFKKELRDKLIIVGQSYEGADYIINNFLYEVDIEYDDKYKIPDNFKKVFEIKRGKILISEVYKKVR